MPTHPHESSSKTTQKHAPVTSTANLDICPNLRLVKKPQACHRLQISMRSLEKLIASGVIPARRLPGLGVRVDVIEAEKRLLG